MLSDEAKAELREYISELEELIRAARLMLEDFPYRYHIPTPLEEPGGSRAVDPVGGTGQEDSTREKETVHAESADGEQ